MTRQQIRFDPSQKLFESFNDFSGGMNNETSNERLRNNEFINLTNVDLSGRGSARRRTGRISLVDTIPIGKAQGMFHYYRKGQDIPDIIVAVSGKLYRIPNSGISAIEIPITGLPSGFQKTLPVEAAQYNSDLFIATGTKLVEYNGTEAKVVEPYKPSAMEAIYIGTNGLADNPDAYIQDGEAGTLTVSGIRPNMRSGVTNRTLTLTAFISKPASMTSVDYKWEYKKSDATTWTLGRDFTAQAAGKSWDFVPQSTGKYDFRVTVRETGKTTTTDYTLTNYPVNDVEDKTNQLLPVSGIQKCRKILLHWDRLLLAKDDVNPNQMYISDLNNPRYFPTTNSINFDANKQEPITALVRYRDMLVIFTRTTIQTLTGKSPADYRRVLIHDGLGCVADRSAQVIGNNVIFLSNEGVQMLSPTPLSLDTLNVKSIDYPIRSLITKDEDACAMVHENQYWLCLPSRYTIFRYYYESGVWVQDTSVKLNFVEFLDYNNGVYELTKDGKLYKQDKTVYNDVGEVYSMRVDSKYYDLSIMFNYKKLKNLYVLAKHYEANVDLMVTVFADSAITFAPESGQAIIENGVVKWKTTTTPNMHFYSGTVVGEWVLGVNPLGSVQLSVQKGRVRGKCRRVKLVFEHTQDSPCEVYAFGFEFKAKKI